MKFYTLFLGFCLYSSTLCAQNSTVHGTVSSSGKIAFATVSIHNSRYGTSTDSAGRYKIENLPAGRYTIKVSAVGYKTQGKTLNVEAEKDLLTDFFLLPSETSSLNEVVVTGTMKEVSRLASPVPVEVYTPAFFRKNPTPSIFDALQNVN